MIRSAAAALGSGLFAAGVAQAQRRGRASESLFLFSDDRVPMNAANLCPMPRIIAAKLTELSEALDRDLSAAHRRGMEGQRERARSDLARQIGASADEIAIVRNTSEANNIIVQGLDLAPGDEVLLWDENHPSNGIAWHVRAQRTGFGIRRLALSNAMIDIAEAVDAFIGSLRDETRVVSFTHISNVSGLRLPIREICSAIRARAPWVHIHIDGAQTLGVVPIDLGTIACDSFSASAHKWYMGPREVGVLFVRDARIGHIWPSVVSLPWGGEINPEVQGARRFEALGQRNDAAIAAFAETVQLHEQLTPRNTELRATELANRLRSALIDVGAPFVSSLAAEFTSNVIVVKVPPDNRTVLVERLFEEAGIITAPVNGLRIAPHIYNTPEHIDRLVSSIRNHRTLLG
jgi:isopenicillin-N epimerase